MTEIHTRIYATAQFGIPFDPGGKWHLIDDDRTVCGIEVSGNWLFGQKHPDAFEENYCKKCTSRPFIVLKGVEIK